MTDFAHDRYSNDLLSSLSKASKDWATHFAKLLESLGSTGRQSPEHSGVTSPMQSLGDQFTAMSQAILAMQQMIGHEFPAIGYFREYVVIGERVRALVLRFQRHYAEFSAQGLKIVQDAQSDLRRRLDSDPLLAASPEALFDAWTDCAERAHSQFAHGEHYSRLFGDLCNCFSELKLERSKIVARVAQHLDLPSRSEVDQLHREVRALSAAAVKASIKAASRARARKGQS